VSVAVLCSTVLGNVGGKPWPRPTLSHCAVPTTATDATGEPAVEPHQYVITEFAPRATGRNLVVKVEGQAGDKTVFTSMDFLGFGASPEVAAAGKATLEEFSLGSCGPRGFYGTTSKHLELEEALAHFFSAPESITYSDAVAAVASAIPAFAKRGDLLLMDAGVNNSVQLGAKLSRSKVVLFKHNDMADLERRLEAVAKSDRVKRDESLAQRRFIVVEGLYLNYGDVAPLNKIVELARKYKWRTMVDDTGGVGVLGATGRGTTEHCGLAALDVTVLLGSLATSLSSVGGFCVGSREVVDHQRLSGAGYCFSASAPPFLCATATAALARLKATPERTTQLQERAHKVHTDLQAALASTGARVVSDPISPIKHVQLDAAGGSSRAPMVDRVLAGDFSAPGTPAVTLDSVHLTPSDLAAVRTMRAGQDRRLAQAVSACCAAGVLVTYTHYLPTEVLAPEPTLRFCVTLAHTDEELRRAVEAIARAVGTAATGSFAAGTTSLTAASGGAAAEPTAGSDGGPRRRAAAGGGKR